MKKIRIIDVAEDAKVSKSTVSQYLNGRFEYMSQETKERIAKSIKKLNYIPNHMARSLKRDKSKTIGLIVRDISGPYTSRVVRGVAQICKEQNYNVFIYNTSFDKEVEKRSINVVKEMQADGLLIVASGNNNHIIAEEVKKGLPVVQIQQEFDEIESSIVISDYEQGTYDATEYLIGLGHKRICFLSQKFGTYKSRHRRLKGYKRALEDNNIQYDEELIQFWDSVNGFHKPIETILAMKNPPTVFFPQHLGMTIDLLTELKTLNISIPQDISVIGFDDVPRVEHFNVPLTVVAQTPHKIGYEAGKVLLNSINNESKEIIRMVLPCNIIERESCRKID